MYPGTSELAEPVRKLGWFIPKPDGTVDIGLHSSALSAEIWAEFTQIVDVIIELRPFVIDYLTLENDYSVLEEVEGSITAYLESMENVFGLGGVQQTVLLAKGQGALSNFLAAASAFRDRAGTRLRERYGKDSLQAKQLRAAIGDAYDASFAYRLLYNLRNYSQHHDSPLSVIPTHCERQESGNMLFVVSLALKPKEMLRSKEIQKSFRLELGGQPDEIQLIPLVTDYFWLHRSIMKVIIDMHVPRLMKFQDYGRLVLTKLRLPEGAAPVIWEGEDPQRRPLRLCHFSFDEFAFVHQLHQRLGEPPAA